LVVAAAGCGSDSSDRAAGYRQTSASVARG
jgi:hypothetical protein